MVFTDLERYDTTDVHNTDKWVPPNSRQIFRICLNLKTLIDKIIPIVFEEKEITAQNSPILNQKVIKLVYRAAGGKGDGEKGTSSYRHRAVLVFCLLKVCDWYWQQSEFELWDNELFSLRAVAAQQIAVIVIDKVEDDEYLFLRMLCQRYVINLYEKDTQPVSALEMAVDMHSTRVIASSGYQRCMKWLWRGWIIPTNDPTQYAFYKGSASISIKAHFDPARIKAPLYQNILEIFFSILYIVLFTLVLNGHKRGVVPLDIFEILFYLYSAGAVLNELTKFYHVGINYIGFFNAFNGVMYAIITLSTFFRILCFQYHGKLQEQYDHLSFRVLSCAAPFMWTRLLLYLDAQKFVGAMLVVVNNMMKESIIFFILLGFVIVGFLQGFLGLDASDGQNDATKHIFLTLLKAVIGQSSLNDIDDFVPPYASILYSVYSFLLSVILMNILIALYSSSYANIIANANDEYFALVAQKTLRYTRVPDEELYVPPFNLIELFVIPLSYFISKRAYKTINYYIMIVIYSPLLVYITLDELKYAKRIQYNRFKGISDDANEVDTEWDLTDGYNDGGDFGVSGIRERSIEVNTAVENQRQGELEDPEFPINLNSFSSDIDKVVKPVHITNKIGMKWELYDVYEKLDGIGSLLEKLVQENKELRDRLDSTATK
ncbi:Piso0_001815 [Millerozyma farinosa CBS 7064]|uniref:Piso0_001815 protein n=1 Tax=Pichia sorbitophila (strain ATCC MYA-4447 / BCRC 22081 / CBS 7064 / NBRC 10061 / NRRL Y-12695) TaxID=559304 RepID=G8YLT4_PICSO|nr:Piso0_001815 [Millerozyma farinosa CBS 7064]